MLTFFTSPGCETRGHARAVQSIVMDLAFGRRWRGDRAMECGCVATLMVPEVESGRSVVPRRFVTSLKSTHRGRDCGARRPPGR
jgi:hypothetical protein